MRWQIKRDSYHSSDIGHLAAAAFLKKDLLVTPIKRKRINVCYEALYLMVSTYLVLLISSGRS